jgi:2-methylcitrate dehydratase
MQTYDVTLHSESERLPRESRLAWKIAEVASNPVELSHDVTEMIINRIIDNGSLAVASLNRRPVGTARDQALAQQRPGGATLFRRSAERSSPRRMGRVGKRRRHA